MDIFVHWINFIVPMMFQWSAQILPLDFYGYEDFRNFPSTFFSKQIRFPPVVSSLSTTYHLVMTNACFTKVSESWTQETCRPCLATGAAATMKLWSPMDSPWFTSDLVFFYYLMMMIRYERWGRFKTKLSPYGILWHPMASYGILGPLSLWELISEVIQRLRATTCFIWVCLGLEEHVFFVRFFPENKCFFDVDLPCHFL